MKHFLQEIDRWVQESTLLRTLGSPKLQKPLILGVILLATTLAILQVITFLILE
jgi:hypothetical protein